MTTQTARAERTFEDFATVAGVEYHVELRPCEDSDGYWFKLEQHTAEGWRYVMGHHVPDASNLLDGLRGGFREPRKKMKNWLQSWRSFRDYARQEPAGNVNGSKRAYYTRHANEALKIGMAYAPQWRLCKAVWQQLTRLNRI